MGSGTDIARESADVILISSDLNDRVRTVHTARRARRIVMLNFAGTIVIDFIGMALAAFIHVGSETAFILNSARLIPGRQTRRCPDWRPASLRASAPLKTRPA